MLQRFEITAMHQDVRQEARTYAKSKLATLDRYLPEHTRASVRMEVRLRPDSRTKKQQRCEATLHLPRRVLAVTEVASTIEAAIDLAKTTLKLQIQRYKDELASGKHRRHVSGRLQRRMPDMALYAGGA